MDIKFYQSQNRYRVYFDKGCYKKSFYYDIDRTETILSIIEKQTDEQCLREFYSKCYNCGDEKWTLVNKESISPDIQGQIDDLLREEYSELENKINRLSYSQKGSIRRIALMKSDNSDANTFYVSVIDDNVYLDVDKADYENTSSFAKESLILSIKKWIKTLKKPSLYPKQLIVQSQNEIIAISVLKELND